MAFPYGFESNFEQGDFSEWDSETDVAGILNVKHYTKLAGENATTVGPIAPWRGAYVAEWNLAGDTSDHVLTEGDMNCADANTVTSRFYLFLGKDFRVTADDTFNIFELQGTANAVESAVGLRVTNSTQAVEIGTGQTAPTAFAATKLVRGQWYCVELVTAISTGVSGSSTLWLDGVQVATVTGLTNTEVLQGVLGTQDTLSTTFGHIYIDAFVYDNATRVAPHLTRYPTTLYVTKSIHVCLGESELLNVTLLPGTSTDSVLKIYDTDRAYITDETNVKAHLYNLTASEPPIDLADVPVHVRRGAYVELAGTAPRAVIHIGYSQGYHSAGRVRQHGFNVKSRTIGG